jgi:hypothetical protein
MPKTFARMAMKSTAVGRMSVRNGIAGVIRTTITAKVIANGVRSRTSTMSVAITSRNNSRPIRTSENGIHRRRRIAAMTSTNGAPASRAG